MALRLLAAALSEAGDHAFDPWPLLQAFLELRLFTSLEVCPDQSLIAVDDEDRPPHVHGRLRIHALGSERTFAACRRGEGELVRRWGEPEWGVRAPDMIC